MCVYDEVYTYISVYFKILAYYVLQFVFYLSTIMIMCYTKVNDIAKEQHHHRQVKELENDFIIFFVYFSFLNMYLWYICNLISYKIMEVYFEIFYNNKCNYKCNEYHE